MNDIKRVTFSERSRSRILHVEIPGAIIDVRMVRGPDNVPMTLIEILPDDETIFHDMAASRSLNIRIMDRAELPGVLCATVPEETRYTLDQCTSAAAPLPEDEFSFAEFVDANAELDTKDLTAVADLLREQTYKGGGGAAAQWIIRRVR